MKRFFLLFLFLVGVSTSSYAGKVYKWTDEKGQIHYSTFPPAETETEKVRVPSSTQSSKESSGSGNPKLIPRSLRYSQQRDEKRRYREERRKKQAAKNYERKYGPEARLKKLEADKRQKKAHADRVHRERIRRIENEKKAREFDKKMDKYKQKAQGLEGDCKAAHGTDCTNPEYLRKWVKKKYEPKAK